MPETDNHGYNVPNAGDQDWHVPLNENFENYDTDIEIRDEEANLGTYLPKDGAKFLATDTERVYVGDGSGWNRLDTSGRRPEFERLDAILTSGQREAVNARTSSGENTATGVHAEASSDSGNTFGTYSVARSPEGHGVFGVNFADSGEAIGVEGRATSPDGVGVRATNTGGGLALDAGASRFRGDVVADRGLQANGPIQFDTAAAGNPMTYMYASGTNNPDQMVVAHSPTYGNWGLAYDDENDRFEFLRAGTPVLTVDLRNGGIQVAGDVDATGSKNFVQSVETDDGEREVVYAATEAGTAHTEVSGVAELDGGRAEVALPDHFGWVTSDEEPLVVQVTPHATEPVRPQVTERSTRRIVIEDFEEGTGDYEVSYTVKGTRAGFADREVVREPTADAVDEDASPAPADD